MKVSPAGPPVVPCGQTDGRTDMTTTIVAFRNFVNAPKNTSPHDSRPQQ